MVSVVTLSDYYIVLVYEWLGKRCCTKNRLIPTTMLSLNTSLTVSGRIVSLVVSALVLALLKLIAIVYTLVLAHELASCESALHICIHAVYTKTYSLGELILSSTVVSVQLTWYMTQNLSAWISVQNVIFEPALVTTLTN